MRKTKRTRKQILAQEHEIQLFLEEYRKKSESLRNVEFDLRRYQVTDGSVDGFLEHIETINSEVPDDIDDSMENYTMFSNSTAARRDILSKKARALDINAKFTREEQYGEFLDLEPFHQQWLSVVKDGSVSLLQFLGEIEKFTTKRFLLTPAVNRGSARYQDFVKALLCYLQDYLMRAYPLQDWDKIHAEIQATYCDYKSHPEEAGDSGLFCIPCEMCIRDRSEDDSEDGEGEEGDVQDIIDFSGDEEETSKNAKKTGKAEKKPSSKQASFPLLELSDDEEEQAANDGEDDVTEYFTTTNAEASKHKKGSFASFGLSKFIISNIAKKGFRQPTPIQRKTIPLILQKRDIVGMARTGSGKTAAFVLPMIERLKGHSAKIGARAVIMSPSRELALQTHKVFREFSRGSDLRSVLLTGGESLEEQFGLMMSNPDVVIATPGRFLHLKVEMNLDLKSIEYVVFDEADRLFEMGFEEQLNELLAAFPVARQTLLFSATLPSSLVDFAKAGLTSPVLVRLDTETKVSENLEMLYLSSKNEEREANLLYLLQEAMQIPVATEEQLAEYRTKIKDDYDSDDSDSKDKLKAKKKKKAMIRRKMPAANELPSEHATIVFVPTRHHVEYITQLLKDCGYLVSYLYGCLLYTSRCV